MSSERLLRILSHFKPEDSPLQICQRSAGIMEVTGAGIALMTNDPVPSMICDAFQYGVSIADLEYILGEGPCRDAYLTSFPIVKPNLSDPHCKLWANFPSEAVRMGVHAVFAFPMNIGSIRLGSFYFYRDTPGELNEDRLADGICLANAAARIILGIPIADIVAGKDNFAVVHQAAGIVSVQLGVSVAEGLTRLRARAFSSQQPLPEVAAMVVAHKIRFDLDGLT